MRHRPAAASVTRALLVISSLAACGGTGVTPPADADASADQRAPTDARDATRDDAARPDAPVPLDAAGLDAAAPDAAPDAAASTPHAYTERVAAIMNPERGFHWFNNLVGTTSLASVRASGSTLVQSNAMLDVARTAPIPAARLAAFDTGLNAARTAGVKVALRFLYDDTAAGRDAPLARVLEHIEQLRPLLARHADVIAVMPAGFVGAWGEWHSSANGLTAPDAQRQIVDALLAALPASRAIQLRTPMFKRGLFGDAPLDPALAFTGAPAARVGHHNDCFLASATDQGTYPSGMVDALQTYIAAETLYVPMGGETCAVHARAACGNAVAEMARLHVSYLNRDYHPDVIQGWRDGGCYDEIERRLGYRFVLRGASFPDVARRGQSFTLEVEVYNDGFAPTFNARPVVLVWDTPGGRFETPLASADPRRWAPGAVATLRETVRVPDLAAPGPWSLSLWLPDADPGLRARPEYSVQFANRDTWNAGAGHNTLGTVRVE